MTNLDAYALDESKLKGLIEDLDTAHIRDIDLSATSSALSSLWDMVEELRAQLADAEKRGMIAGMEAAEKAVRARVMGDGNHDDAEAKRCADVILAMIEQAMEAGE